MKIHNLIFLIPGIFLLNLIPVIVEAQSHDNDSGIIKEKAMFRWPEGKKMAISLTFDDSRLSQVESGIPLLDRYNVKATFYVSPGNMLQRVNEWRNAVNNGHEIGNHSVFHPCSGNFSWSRKNALENYTIDVMREELDSANRLINENLGIIPVSFAYPCGQTFVGRGEMTRSYVPLVSEMFESGRGWLNEYPNDPAFCDMSQLAGTELDGKSFEQIRSIVESAALNGQWLILAGHEMNDEGYQTSLLLTIEEICRYATSPSDSIWIDNVHNIASYINKERIRLKLLQGE